jgi:hypothetical protein
MNSTLSLIPSLDNFLSINPSTSKKDYTYAEQYPVFISQEKLSKLIGNPSNVHARSTLKEPSSKRSSDSSSSPFTKRSPSKTQSLEFRMSKFPNSSLNVELEKQCLISELYQNIEKLKQKSKLFPPIKVIWPVSQKKSLKSDVKSARVNMRALLNGETLSLPCSACHGLRCICQVTDSFCDQTWDRVKHKYSKRTDIYHPVVKSKLLGRTPRFQSVPSESNYYAERISLKRTKRRRKAYNNYENLPNELLQVSPKNLYMKVLEDDFN